MNEDFNSGKPNAETYEAKFLNGTSSIGDYIIFGNTADNQFILGVKPLIEVLESNIRFAARIRVVVNPEKEPPLLSTQGGSLMVTAFPNAVFSKIDEKRCSMMMTNTVEYTQDELPKLIAENVKSLLRYIGKMTPETQQQKAAQKYLEESYTAVCSAVLGTKVSTQKTTVSHLSLAKKPSDKVDATD